VAVGVVVGTAARATDPSPKAVELLGFPGELFMRLLRALVLPLVSVSMVCGVLALSEKTSAAGARRAVGRLIGSYVLTTLVACFIGLVVVHVVRPGVGVALDASKCVDSNAASGGADADGETTKNDENAALDSTLATARAAVPANLFEAAAQGNVLGIIAASLFFGTALAVNLNQNVPESVRDERETNDVRDERRRRDVRVVADLFLGLNAVVDVAVGWAVKNVPIGVCSIVAARIAGTCDPARALAALLKYVFAVLLGLAVHGLVALPAMYTALVAAREGGRRGLARDARRAPLDAFAVLRGGAPAFAAAFATDSSSAALPKTIQCALDLRVPASIAKFSLPLGATLNMNGTALYEALTVLFVAQVHDVDLSLGQTLVVALTSTVAAVGAAAIPSAGLVTMFIVLQAAGLGKYGDDVGALLALDWFLDRARTVVNVEGDLFVAAALAAWEAPPDETEDARWVSEGDVGDVSS
jgi:Na+/H+-dicarboxylate symporter